MSSYNKPSSDLRAAAAIWQQKHHHSATPPYGFSNADGVQVYNNDYQVSPCMLDWKHQYAVSDGGHMWGDM